MDLTTKLKDQAWAQKADFLAWSFRTRNTMPINLTLKFSDNGSIILFHNGHYIADTLRAETMTGIITGYVLGLENAQKEIFQLSE